MRATLPPVVTFGPDTPREDLVSEILRINAKAMRCPHHYTVRWGSLHDELNRLLGWLGY